MKTSLSLTLLLFIQPIIGNLSEHLTFFSLLEKLYSKAETTIDFKLRPKLDFMITFPKNSYEIKPKLKAPSKEIPNNLKGDLFMGKVPANMEINGENAKNYFRKLISSIGDGQGKIVNLNSEILKMMSFKPSEKHDDTFDSSVDNWNENKLVMDHVQQIANDINTMRTEYNECQVKFNKEMEVADKLRTSIDKGIEAVTNWLRKILKTSNVETRKKIIKNEEPKISTIFEFQEQMIDTLGILKEILEDYNNKRFKWLEYIIGMRDTLTAVERHSVKLVKQIKEIDPKSHLVRNFFGAFSWNHE
ncbi:uncharacterized protein LOC116339961 [Contarinia nasturtii]|uniref:uncharacterized protein LOC116339961 n=1 Tax=Contarinia nasturtii TaxID=265458 RepID=UPI0012D39E22|nr:uncharacterized protein LOC116339961 [Contarinia nasturtii]